MLELLLLFCDPMYAGGLAAM